MAACPPCQHGAFASRRNASSGDGAVCWNDAVNASCITLDSCGKADDPHNLEGGALAARAGHISRRSAVAPSTHAGTLLLERLATARRTPSTLAEYARAASAGNATDMPASACALF